MAASGTLSKKQMKRMESRKSHSWWWDSHISPKNSKWLAENLEGMDKSVKRMLKLIEEDGDSFAKKAEMYYQKRPELIFLVEDFYRMYRSLAERYDHVAGELRKNIPFDLQSQGSGISGSDIGSEQSSTLPSPRKLGHRKSSNRAAGFDFFLGSGGNGSDVGPKEGYESSTLTDSEEESDDSSINNDSGLPGNISNHHGHSRKIMELEIELRDLKEKLWLQQEENAEREARNENTEDIHAKVNGYEQELRTVNEKLRLSEEEISVLKIELDRLRSLESANSQVLVEFSSIEEDVKTGGPALALKTSDLQGSVYRLEQELLEPDSKIKSLEEELRITKEKLEASKMQIASLEFEATKSSERIQQLQDQLDSACQDIAVWKTKFNSERRDSSKLLERLASIKISLLDRDHEIMDLKAAVSDAEQKILPEKSQVEAEMSKWMGERTHLEEQIREWECRGRSFEEEIRKINCGKAKMEEALKGEIEQLMVDIKKRENNIKDVNASFNALKLERDNLNTEVGLLKGEVKTRDDRVEQLAWHLNQLHMEHVKLIAGMEEAHKQVEELKLRAKELEDEVERQRTEILEGAEEKREAIRQLCLSLEHYRNDYDRLRQDYKGRKRVSVLAA